MSSDHPNGPPTPPTADPDGDSPEAVRTMIVPGGVRPVNPADLTRALPESDPDTLPPLPDIPGYEVYAKLGEGGMGVVYHARELKLNRPVALTPTLPPQGEGDGGYRSTRSGITPVA